MPAMHFRLRWPDDRETECYSPSTIIKDYLIVGAAYDVDDFMRRMREALPIASERVRQKFGFACSRANDQLIVLEEIAIRFEARPGQVTVLAFSDAH